MSGRCVCVCVCESTELNLIKVLVGGCHLHYVYWLNYFTKYTPTLIVNENKQFIWKHNMWNLYSMFN